MLDRFAALGKPLHVTELGVFSRADRDEQSIGKDPTQSHWHPPWSEGVQADWVEQFYRWEWSQRSESSDLCSVF